MRHLCVEVKGARNPSALCRKVSEGMEVFTNIRVSARRASSMVTALANHPKVCFTLEEPDRTLRVWLLSSACRGQFHDTHRVDAV